MLGEPDLAGAAGGEFIRKAGETAGPDGKSKKCRLCRRQAARPVGYVTMLEARNADVSGKKNIYWKRPDQLF